MEANLNLLLKVECSVSGDNVELHDVKIGSVSILKKLEPEELEQIKEQLKGEDVVRETFTLEVDDVPVEIEYSYTKGTKDYFSKSMEQWYPGDPDEVEIEGVYYNGLDIKDGLSMDIMSDLTDKIYEEHPMDESKKVSMKQKHKIQEANDNRPALYVGTYGKYASGSIDGKWMYLDDYASKEDFLAAAAELHKDEEDPEFMYQDFQNFPEQYYSESGLPDELWDWLALDDEEKNILEAYIEATGDKNATIQDAQDKFQGKYKDLEDWAYEMVQDVGVNHPEWYIEVDQTTARQIALDDADSQASDLRYYIKKEDFEEVFDRTDKYKEEYEALKEKLEDVESDEDEEQADKVKEEMVKLAEKAIDEWESEYVDEVADKIHDDPVGYFVDEQGIYTIEELAKTDFVGFDYGKFVRDAEMGGDIDSAKVDGEVYVFWSR